MGCALKLKPMANFLCKPKSKLALGSKRKPASMVGLDAGLGFLGMVTQHSSSLLKNELEEGTFLPSQSAQYASPELVMFLENVGRGLAYSGDTDDSSSGSAMLGEGV